MLLVLHLLFFWCGGVTSDSAEVVARFDAAAPAALVLEFSTAADFRGPTQQIAPTPAAVGDDPSVARFSLRGLTASTRYHYRFLAGGAPVTLAAAGAPADASTGTFQTLPAPHAPASFTFAFASCADTGSNHPVFRRIQSLEPAFFLQLGDLHYEDIAEDSRARFRAAYQRLLTAPAQAALYRAVPIAYLWDDHDFGPNGSDRLSPSRAASHATYRELVPHHPFALPGPQAPIARRFVVGRTLFLLLDTRSARDPAEQPDGPGKTMLGRLQLEWLKQELLTARAHHPLIFIASPVSWVSNETERRDNWGRYATERAALSDWMVEQQIRGVCFLSGDAHMLAADDGRNNRYGRRQGPGFPALQAASLDRGGSIKGGPWSVAPVVPAAGEGQFGLVEVSDHGTRLDVNFRGLNHEGTEKLRLSFSVSAE